jgi:hypothetical protein
VRRTISDGGLCEDVERGISLGCPLSPLMGALYLKLLDERVKATGLTYARFGIGRSGVGSRLALTGA